MQSDRDGSSDSQRSARKLMCFSTCGRPLCLIRHPSIPILLHLKSLCQGIASLIGRCQSTLPRLPSKSILKNRLPLESLLENGFLPGKILLLIFSYSSLRHVPGYPYAMQERFSRCLDLYLCPRAKKSRLNIDPESMLPKLPELSDLRPYPNVLGLKLDATTYPTSSPITSMAIDATGHWLLAGFADGSLTLSDVIFGKTYAKWLISEGEDPVSSIAWNPTAQLGSLAAISCGSKLILLNLFIGSSVQQSLIGNLFNALQKNESWIQKRLISLGKEIPLEVVSFAINSHAITRLAWHRKGDYLASVAPKGTPLSFA